ncbi:MAG TPA: YhbY family RNA-binding protein [Rhodanobacteraceae bacterium]|nr:YhbY family RNA-binding protein [Rhodanobacteraceae bacterium]
MPVTASQRRYLRELAHPLKPVLLLGAKGVTAPLLAELDVALDHHELIKVRLSGDRAERANQLEQLLASSHAEAVQSIGHVAALYRANRDKPKLALPR